MIAKKVRSLYENGSKWGFTWAHLRSNLKIRKKWRALSVFVLVYWGITTEALGVANSGFERSSSNSAQERNAQHAQPQHNRSRSSAVEKGMGVVWLKKINKIINQRKSGSGPTSTDYRAAR